MKRKTLISITSLLLGASILTACTSTSKKVSFSPYWFKTYNLPTESAETLTYNVSFEAGSGLSHNYTLDCNGTYTTVLTTKSDESGKKLYRYETSLALDVTYYYGGEEITKQDTITSYVEFEQSTTLTPLVSHKEIVNHSPVNKTVSSLEECFTEYKYTWHTTYDSDGTGGTCVLTDNSASESAKKTQTFEIDNDYTHLDNEQLLFALRGVNPSSSSSPSVLVYAPFTNATQTIDVSFGSKVEGNEFNFKKDAETEKKKRAINYYPVTISIDSSNPGPSQTLWIAETSDAMSNEYRNVILRMEAPIAYNLGTVIYELDSAVFSN